MTKQQVNDVMTLMAEYQELHPEWRKGQSFFNALYVICPEAANEIRATMMDPFYRDEILEETIKYLENG